MVLKLLFQNTAKTLKRLIIIYFVFNSKVVVEDYCQSSKKIITS